MYLLANNSEILGTHLAIKKSERLHTLERKAHGCIQDGAQDGMMLHQWVVDRLLLERQFHYRDGALHGQPGILSVQDWHLHFIPANVSLWKLRREDYVRSWRTGTTNGNIPK